ncbi:MAG: cytochrome C554, partial [Pirellulaceae bacterium]
SLEKTLAMTGSGCENCHGPGSRHVAAESGDLEVDAAQRTALRRQMQLTLDEARKNKCMQCHDLDNSPDFHDPGAFEKYWQQVRHPGKD